MDRTDDDGTGRVLDVGIIDGIVKALVSEALVAATARMDDENFMLLKLIENAFMECVFSDRKGFVRVSVQRRGTYKNDIPSVQ